MIDRKRGEICRGAGFSNYKNNEPEARYGKPLRTYWLLKILFKAGLLKLQCRGELTPDLRDKQLSADLTYNPKYCCKSVEVSKSKYEITLDEAVRVG
jgi:hypothetical protein